MAAVPTHYYGTVFKLDPSDTLTTLHAFSPFEEGANLRGSLVRDEAGNLYGTTPMVVWFRYTEVLTGSPSRSIPRAQ